ncbi:hypothetical protein WA026_019333 [Henosepilachna vigintioctopunctata]|uniref:Uncharacterized protein n=1 Tax=Henosepilachna vigintioctopunctata TaxID=420089 RepID=A0AAW1U1R3_9CUCU
MSLVSQNSGYDISDASTLHDASQNSLDEMSATMNRENLINNNLNKQDPEESIYHNNTSSCISMCVFNDDVHDPDYDCDGESSEDDGETGYVSVSHQQKVSHGSSVDKKTSEEDKPNARINNVENESNYDNEEILSYENFRDNINNNEFNLQLITVNHNYLGVESSNHTTKKHFCIFCKTKQTKLARHFLNKHKDEADVVLFAKLTSQK